MTESKKIVKGKGSSKTTEGYVVPNKGGGTGIFKGGQGKEGYIGHTERDKKPRDK